MNNKWTYLEKNGNAGLPAKPPRFKDLGQHSIEIFVRELIQNSLDARLESAKPVTVNFSIDELNKSSIRDYLDLIGSEHLKKFKESYHSPDVPPDVKPRLKNGCQIIEGKKTKSFSLIIEEENCIGLTGSITGIDKRSNFNSLIRKIDDNEAKRELTTSGGTWGKGSSVFAYSSELWMWYCYTLLSEPNAENHDNQVHSRRFIGRAVLAPHYNRETGKGYFGDAWYCRPNTDAYPFINEEADLIAETFGLPKRKTETGCTFFIPFFNPFLENPTLQNVVDEFELAILKNWYIPIHSGDLIAKIKGCDGEVKLIDKAYLYKIAPLKFKLEILDWYNSGGIASEKIIRETYEVEVPGLKDDYLNNRNQFAKEKQKVKLDLVIRVFSEDEEAFDNSWETCNKVALARNRGMIVSDHASFDLQGHKTESILFAGLLSKSEPSLDKRRHLDLFLAYSENPAHNKWCNKSQDYNSCFLDYFKGLRPAPEYYINKIFDEIFKSFKSLFDRQQQAETSKDICSIFKKIAKLRVSGATPGGPSLFSMITPANVTNPIVQKDGALLFTYKVKSNHVSGPIELDFRSSIESLEGEITSDFDVLGIADFEILELVDASNCTIERGTNPRISLHPNEEIVLGILTCPIVGRRNFKNVEPRIKTSAKKLENE